MAAWWAVAGTLGGVFVTAVAGLVTALFTHRWQQERLRLEHGFAAGRELRTTRREVYARYLVTSQRLFDAAGALHDRSGVASREVTATILSPPGDLRVPLADNEAARVEALLLASEPVRTALEGYDRALWDLWPRLASGTDRAGRPECTQLYHRLIQAMHDELQDLRPPA
jgi:hypothetical protein